MRHPLAATLDPVRLSRSLAGVLTGVGLLCLAGVRFLGDSGRLGRAAHWLPLVGAGLIAAIGALAAWEALAVLIS